MTERKEYRFTVFVEKINDAFVAHALEAGMLATDDDEMQAVFKLGKMLIRHVSFAETKKRQDEIYRSAPQDVWKRFSAFQKMCTHPQKTLNEYIAREYR